MLQSWHSLFGQWFLGSFAFPGKQNCRASGKVITGDKERQTGFGKTTFLPKLSWTWCLRGARLNAEAFSSRSCVSHSLSTLGAEEPFP